MMVVALGGGVLGVGTDVEVEPGTVARKTLLELRPQETTLRKR
jgi:hypothetical protein